MSRSNNFWTLSKRMIDEFGGVHSSSSDESINDRYIDDIFETKYNISDGYHKIRFSNGNIYRGEFQDGMFQGQGNLLLSRVKFIWSKCSCDQYIGNFRKGKFNGFGTMYYKGFVVYEGNFKDGVFHGYGELKEKDEENRLAQYQGEFVNGKYHGKGMLINVNGTMYKGEFAN